MPSCVPLPSRRGSRALEMIMRDVLDGLQELAGAAALRSGAEGCQILSIEPPSRRESQAIPSVPAGRVVDFQRRKRAV